MVNKSADNAAISSLNDDLIIKVDERDSSSDDSLLISQSTESKNSPVIQFKDQEMVEITNSLVLPHCHAESSYGAGVSVKAKNQLIVVSVLCLLFMIGELVGGVISGSLALMTDATHLASDLASFLISLFAIYMAKKPKTQRMSFGFHRAEVLGALVSVVLIWAITAVLCYMAVDRVVHMNFKIKADEMIIVAGCGVAFNIIMGSVLHFDWFSCARLPTSFGHNHSHAPGSSHSNHSPINSQARLQIGHSPLRSSAQYQPLINSENDDNDDNNDDDVNDYNQSSQTFHQINTSNQNDTQQQQRNNGTHSINTTNLVDDSIITSNQLNNPSVATAEITPNHINPTDAGSSSRSSANFTADHMTSRREQQSDDNDATIIRRRPKMNINVRAAFIHVVGDFIQSIGVLAAAYIIKYKPTWKIADPICTFVFSVLVLLTTINVLRDVVNVLMEGTVETD